MTFSSACVQQRTQGELGLGGEEGERQVLQARLRLAHAAPVVLDVVPAVVPHLQRSLHHLESIIKAMARLCM